MTVKELYTGYATGLDEKMIVIDISGLLSGDLEIVNLPWKPKKGDVYFTFGLLGDKWVVRSLWWGGFPEEYALLDKGWVYHTGEAAESALPEIATEMGVEYKL